MLWVVAGCLFEISLPVEDGPWSWANATPQVTLLAEEERHGRRHLRFRAEEPGEVELRFEARAGRVTDPVTVRIAPERLA